MKKLIFNGCSYTAGDACVWKKFCPNIPWTSKLWSNAPSAELLEKYNQYRVVYRPQHNLGAICASTLNTEKIDLSQDGNVNSRIALETINYILSLRPESRKNYHVCIGWTETSRRLKWDEKHLRFESLHVGHAGNDTFDTFQNYIKEEIILNTEIDHTVHYIKDVMLLENFLKSQGMTYTFWRALGGQPHIPDEVDSVLKISNNISNNENWVLFNHQDHARIVGAAWADILHRWSDFISKENGHPNINAIKAYATRVCDHILKYS